MHSVKPLTNPTVASTREKNLPRSELQWKNIARQGGVSRNEVVVQETLERYCTVAHQCIFLPA